MRYDVTPPRPTSPHGRKLRAVVSASCGAGPPPERAQLWLFAELESPLVFVVRVTRVAVLEHPDPRFLRLNHGGLQEV
jgi:hypothetical protein